MNAQRSQKHEFALYVEQLNKILEKVQAGMRVQFDDEALFHRVLHVLRLQPGQHVVLFDQRVHAQIIFENSGKKSIVGTLIAKAFNAVLAPPITVLLPILKKEAFDEAVYSCTELGANILQLVTTDKTQRTFGGDKELARMRNIMIAAAEQSKNFAMPEIAGPITLADALQRFKQSTSLLCCAMNGEPLLQTIEQIHQKGCEAIALAIGPEGDFTAQEFALLKEHNAIICSLTPTVLRSQQALVVALGLVRSICR